MARKKKAAQVDEIRREWSTSVRGTNLDSMVEQARIQAAKLFNEPLKNIQAISGEPSVITYAKFRTDMDTPAEPDMWQVYVTLRVKDKEDEQVEPAAE